MTKRSSIALCLALIALMAGNARGGVLDDLTKARDLVNAAQPRNAATTAAKAAADAATPDTGLSDLGLRPYPRAVPVRHYSNPLERGVLPISVPDRDNSAGGERVSRWRLPYEARVLLVQYKHSPDDSPLLIARHYAGQLKELGFELLTVCETPCLSASGMADDAIYWSKQLDPGHRLEIRPFGDRGTYFIAHRPDAVVAVRVGAWDSGFGSALKILQAPAIDRTPITQYIESQRAVVANAPLPPPPKPRAAATNAPPTASASVQIVAPRDAADVIARTKGYLVVQVSSFDTRCGFCGPSNDVFDTLSRRADAKDAKFMRVTYQPWTTFALDGFAQSYGVNGLPTFLTMKDGQLVRRRNGVAPADELHKLLLDGLD